MANTSPTDFTPCEPCPIKIKKVVAPIREIQEVKNAIKAYELFEQLNPFNINDLLLAHRTLMEALIDDAGCFRHGNVGVFGDKGQIIHLALRQHTYLD